jgi:hypothetical protein
MEELFRYIRTLFFEITTVNVAAFLAKSLLGSASKLRNLFQSSALTVFLFAHYLSTVVVPNLVGMNYHT